MGYILKTGYVDLISVFVFIGTFLLSLGSSSINQIQEIQFDKLMERTKNRPIPSDKITKQNALYISVILCCLGMYVLVEFVSLSAFIFGFATLVLYNLIYTPMKRWTSFAVIPGALVGAFPPYIGWTAVGNDFLNPLIVSFGLFIFVWQIPHFWILLLIYKDDYKLADYPLVTDKINITQLRNIIYVWIITLTLTSLFIPYFSIVEIEISRIIVFLLIILLSIKLLKDTLNLIKKIEISPFGLFKSINYYVLSVLSIVVIEKMILHFLSK